MGQVTDMQGAGAALVNALIARGSEAMQHGDECGCHVASGMCQL